MPELAPKKNNIVSRYFHGTERLFNKVVTFIVAIFISAIFFIFMLKLLNLWGIILGLAMSIALNVHLKKRYKKGHFYNTLNNGFITFNVFTFIVLIIALLSLNVLQSALN